MDTSRIIYVNGMPIFPIGECFEMETPNKYEELHAAGFNYINLFTENHALNSKFHSYNMISGDRSSSSQYNQLLTYWNFTYMQNANRIFNLGEASNMYILSDDFFDWSDDLSISYQNGPPYQDSVVLNPLFNQDVRNQSVLRLKQLAGLGNSRLMGGFAWDEVNLFQPLPQDPMYYYNTFLQSRINNYNTTYDFFKANNPGQLVFMKIAPYFFPRIYELNNWQDLNVVRQKWIQDARQFSLGSDVLYATDNIDKRWIEESPIYLLYDNGKPSTWLQHYDVLMRDVGNYRKAIWGGLDYDVPNLCGDTNLTDQQINAEVKWHTYMGIIKGATGLIFFGQHHAYDIPIVGRVWNGVKNTVNEMTNILNLDKNVFIRPNSFSVGHTLTGSYSNNLSYAVYQKNYDFNDYWLLVSNNPNGYSNDIEPSNPVTIKSRHFPGKNIKELFSGSSFNSESGDSINIVMPWYGVAIFHVTGQGNNNIVPDIYSVKQYPNPFNPRTKIDYTVSFDNTFVEFRVFDIMGREMKKLISAYKEKGKYEIEFDGTDLASGIYSLRIQIGAQFRTNKMVLLK